MAFTYSLFENPLVVGAKNHFATVKPQGLRTMDDLAERMISRGSTVTKAEVLSVMEEFMQAVEESLREGYSIRTPLFTLRVAIAGSFAGPTDGFDPSCHQVRVVLNPGARIKQAAIPIRKEMRRGQCPVIRSVENAASPAAPVHAGSVLRLRGQLLKFNNNDQQQGVFFRTSEGLAVRADTVIHTQPSEVMVMVPAVPPGKCTVSVRTIFANAKTLREGFFERGVEIRD